MKLLKDILYKTGIEEVLGNTHKAIEHITFDSRRVRNQSLYLARAGTKVDGHDFIDSAISKGATTILCERLPEEIKEEITYVRVKDADAALAFMAANYYDNPSEKLRLVGVTGTNGKTTVATLMYKLFRSLGYKAGLLSTVANKINNNTVESTHTTGDPLQINEILSKMVDAGCKYCFMEVSSHGIHQKRIDGLDFKGAIFTNISHDHLDYHKTFDDYILAKKRFFDLLPENAFALVNKDDRHGGTMVQHTQARIHKFSTRGLADFKAKILDNDFTGLHLSINNQEIHSRLIGSFNAYNLLAVYGAAVLLGEIEINVLTALSTLTAVDGRFQYLRSQNGLTAIVDYAHTPDALKNVLTTIQDIRTGNESVITVVGCGGDRDASKRPEMARIAVNYSTKVILTSDNPRTEDPNAIIDDMEKGVEVQHKARVLRIPDRKEGIKTACMLAEAGDIILIAGKGHEKYQDINGVKHPFDDVLVVKENLEILQK